MKPITFILMVEREDEDTLFCRVQGHTDANSFHYFKADGSVAFPTDSPIAAVIRKNLNQLQKILRSAMDGRLSDRQIIHCVFIEGFHFLKAEYFSRFIRLDRREGRLDISVSEVPLTEVHRIYADGSFQPETKNSGYGGFIESPDGVRHSFFRSYPDGSNNLMELLAVAEGLHRLGTCDMVQVNTDSRFVIRGLVQWVHFWKHNNWQTAYGREVRYRKEWQQACNLCEKKLIEFQWIKGHSGNEEHAFCHDLARGAAMKPTL